MYPENQEPYPKLGITEGRSLECSSMVEQVPSMHKAQDSDPSTKIRTIKIKHLQYETIIGEIPVTLSC